MNNKYTISFIFLLIVISTWFSGTRLEIKPIVGDASQNTSASYYLATKGIYSIDGSDLWNKREPLPNFINAFYLRFFTSIDRNDDIESIIAGNELTVEWLRVNLVILFSTLIAIWWVTFLIFKKHLYSLLTLPFPYLFFTIWPNYLNSMHTELLATLFVTLITGAFIKFYQKPGFAIASLCGLLLALFALTKAAGYYISLVAIPTLAIGLLYFKISDTKRSIIYALPIFIAFAVAVYPWMIRNYIHFNEFTISERGGDELLIRAVKNGMTQEEFIGSFYYYSPMGLRAAIFEQFFGFKTEDLGKNGRLRKLNRYLEADIAALRDNRYDDLFTYYRVAKYKIPREIREQSTALDATGSTTFEVATEKIKSKPLQHIKLSIAFGWRGIWSFGDPNRYIDRYHIIGHIVWIYNFLCFVAFIATFIFSIIFRKPEWFVLTLFAVGIFTFHAFLTHFIPRFSVPIIPIMNICFVLILIKILIKSHQLYVQKYLKIAE